jgi:hypothetical protein
MKKITFINKKALLTISVLFSVFYTFSQTQTFTSSSTFTAPAGVTSIVVEAWGGGGRGGRLTTAGVAGGGGGGGYARRAITVTPGNNYTVTVGAGSSTTAAGGDSWFASTGTILAKGGSSVADNSTSAANGGSVGTGDVTYNGGKGAPGVSASYAIYGGGGGSSACSRSVGTEAQNNNGAIAPYFGGNGGNGRTMSSGSGSPGIAPGGGGGGAYSTTSGTQNGGNGADGMVRISWTPIISVFGNNKIIPAGSITTSISNNTLFGITYMNTPVIRTFSISNSGSSNLLLTGSPRVTISGSSEFIITAANQPATSSLANSVTTTFKVTFNPTSPGLKTAIVSILNNDPGAGKNPFTFRVQGEGKIEFNDTDGDGVFDYYDLDDDNDGIPDSIEQNEASASSNNNSVEVILLNESFGEGSMRTKIYENIPTASTTYCYEDGTAARDFDECDNNGSLNDGEYTVSNSAQIASWGAQYWYKGTDHSTTDGTGRMALFNATVDITAEFYRTEIKGVTTNIPTTYSFWALNLDREDAPGIATRNKPRIIVEIRDPSNNLITSLNTGDIAPCGANPTSTDWKFFSASFLAPTTNFTIIFKNAMVGGSGNDLALDDIVLKQIFLDSDFDGIPDIFDLDSDNDGIADITEAGFYNLSQGKDTMSYATGVWIDANNNGWHDTAESYFASNPIIDTDGDSVPDYLDLDSDNDSIFDVDEAGLFNGDGDINGDGIGDGVDTDRDGILDLFDTYIGFGNNSKSAPFNTSGIGNADYRNKTSKIPGVFDITNTLYAHLDGNNDGLIDGSTDVDRDGILDTFDTNTSKYGSPRDLNRKLLLDFDGRNDYGQGTGVLGGLASASLMAWIDLNNSFSNEGIIIGQDKFQIRINSTKKLEAVVNGTTLTYNFTLNTSQWYHVAAVYGSGFLRLYLNGTQVASQAVTGSIATDASMLTIGKNPTGNNKYLKGKIDEIRVFNIALSDTQLQRMVYQEIQNNASQVRGTVIPKDIGTLPFTNLIRYYRMDAYKDDIIDDWTTPAIDTGVGMKIYNHKNIYEQQAPMPFTTIQSGSFATAVNNPSKDIRGMDIMDYDWSIVQVKHNITETANNTELGMFVDPGVNVIMNNDTKLQNDWYLKLDGKIDLVGKSQLVQTIDSDLDPVSGGFLERDQQGQKNIFNYNYWASPVGAINSTSNNNSFTVASVMKDGTNPNSIQNILWTSGLNGSPTSPITLSSYWIFKFQNLNNNYANWASVGPNGTLLAGQGYTLKGSGAAGTNQNFTFMGKPNNGTITSPIAANNMNLSGNPYASAIDANAFITKNSSSTTGTLYFWEHYNTNNSHFLSAYQGGYATRNLTGGTAPIAPAGISGLGSSTKTPGRYIPVGQGFFVKGSAIGGNIIFENAQRIFIKEENANSNTLFRLNTNQLKLNSYQFNNTEDTVEESAYAKIRLGINTVDNYHREILIGFMEENATSDIDYGYDAVHIDEQPSDMYFINGTTKLNIQGDGYFNDNNIYPLGIKNSVEGNVKIMIDAIENFDESRKIFIYDNETEIYHNIKNEPFEIKLPDGTVENRFSLRFTDTNALGINSNEINENIIISLSSINNMINIKNESQDNIIKSVSVFNLLGQEIISKNTDNQHQNLIQLSAQNLSIGTYIVKVNSEKGSTSKKILIQ